MGIRFKSPTHARIFIFAFSGTCLGVYFSPVFYYAFVRPYKEEHGYPIKEPLQKPDLYPFVAVRPGPYIASEHTDDTDNSKMA